MSSDFKDLIQSTCLLVTEQTSSYIDAILHFSKHTSKDRRQRLKNKPMTPPTQKLPRHQSEKYCSQDRADYMLMKTIFLS